MGSFDYNTPAELFHTRGQRSKGPVDYRRFDTAAQAIRFAIEELSAPMLLGPTFKSKTTGSTASKSEHCMKMLRIP